MYHKCNHQVSQLTNLSVIWRIVRLRARTKKIHYVRFSLNSFLTHPSTHPIHTNPLIGPARVLFPYDEPLPDILGEKTALTAFGTR